jgi:hypothetical protein
VWIAAPRNELDTNIFGTDSLFRIRCQPFSTLLNVVIHLLMELLCFTVTNLLALSITSGAVKIINCYYYGVDCFNMVQFVYMYCTQHHEVNIPSKHGFFLNQKLKAVGA